MSFPVSFKPTINRLVDKAYEAYYIMRQTFTFNNGCSPRVIQKLSNIMVVSILSYGAEIWASFGWRRQWIRSIKQYIFKTRHPCEKLQSKSYTYKFLRNETKRFPMKCEVNSITYFQFNTLLVWRQLAQPRSLSLTHTHTHAQTNKQTHSYQFEKYLDSKHLPELKRNVSAIGTLSTYRIPSEKGNTTR